jgi:hypothetical protein
MNEMMLMDPHKKAEIPLNSDSKSIQKYLDSPLIERVDNGVDCFFRVYWVLWKIFNWRGFSNIKENSEEENQKTVVWTTTLKWIFEDMNSKILGNTFIQLYLEILFDLFLNHELMSNQKILKSLKKYWKKINKVKITNPVDEDPWMLVDEGELYTSKLIILLIEMTFDKKFELDIAFFVIKVLNLSMFEQLFKEKEMVLSYLTKIMQKKIEENRFWMYYSPIESADIEERIVRVLEGLELTKEEFQPYRDLALKNR